MTNAKPQHPNAALTPRQRRKMVLLVIDDSWTNLSSFEKDKLKCYWINPGEDKRYSYFRDLSEATVQVLDDAGKQASRLRRAQLRTKGSRTLFEAENLRERADQASTRRELEC